MIAARQPGAADEQFPGHPRRYRLQIAIKKISAQIRQRTADDTALPLRPRPVLIAQRHMHGGLGDPIHVDKTRMRVAIAREPRDEAVRLQRLAAEDDKTQGKVPARRGESLRRQKLTESRRRLVQHGHPLAPEQLIERSGARLTQ